MSFQDPWATPGDPFATVVPETVMPFGKHRGKPLSEVAKTDRGYLDWVVKKADLASPELKAACQAAMGIQSPTMFGEAVSPEAASAPVSPPWVDTPGPRMISIPQVDLDAFKKKSRDDDAMIGRLKAEIAQLKKDAKAKDRPGEIHGVKLIVRRWFGVMSKRFHPDAGGSAEQQTVVNVCYRELTTMLEGA